MRVKLPNMKELVQQQMTLDMAGVNQRAHEKLHGPRTMVFTSTATLNTTAGSPLRFPRGGQVTAVSCKLANAPTSLFKVDVLIDSISVFDGTYLQVAIGDTASKFKIVERPYFNEDSSFQIQINTVGGAVGPMVLAIEILEEY